MWLNGISLSAIIVLLILIAEHGAASFLLRCESDVYYCRCNMRILIVCGAPEGKKGLELAAADLIEAMRSRGHEVTAVCSDRDKAGIEDCVVLSGRGIRNSGYERKDTSQLSESVFSSLELMTADSDAVHIMAPTAIGRAALRYCLRYNIPVTAGFYAETTLPDTRASAGRVRLACRILYRMRYNSFYSYADAVLYPSPACRRLLENAASAETNGFVLTEGSCPKDHGGGVFSGEDSADTFENMLCSVR